MLGFVGSDVRDSGKDVAAVGCGTLDTVTMVDTTLASFMVDVKVAKVVVKVDGPGTEVSSKQGGVGCEDGGDIDMTLAAQGDAHTSEPLVEVCDHGRSFLMGHELVSHKRDAQVLC